MTAGSDGCIHHGRAGGAETALDTKRQRIEERLRTEFTERGEATPSAETLAILVGRELTEAARARAADPERRSEISQAVQERQRQERLDGRLDKWRKDIELPQTVALLRKYVAGHPEREEAQARDYLDRFEKALRRGSRATSVLAAFRHDRELRGRVFSEGLGRHGWQAHRGSRYKAGVDQCVALAWRGSKEVPRLRELIQPAKVGRPTSQHIPDEFRSQRGVRVFAAMVRGLLESGLDGIEIAPLFGWKVYDRNGRHCPMVTAFSRVAAELATSRRLKAEWEEAVEAAGPYIRELAHKKSRA